jgi:hypothetical protein
MLTTNWQKPCQRVVALSDDSRPRNSRKSAKPSATIYSLRIFAVFAASDIPPTWRENRPFETYVYKGGFSSLAYQADAGLLKRGCD